MPSKNRLKFFLDITKTDWDAYGNESDRAAVLMHAPLACRIYKPSPGSYLVTVVPRLFGLYNHYVFQRYTDS